MRRSSRIDRWIQIKQKSRTKAIRRILKNIPSNINPAILSRVERKIIVAGGKSYFDPNSGLNPAILHELFKLLNILLFELT